MTLDNADRAATTGPGPLDDVLTTVSAHMSRRQDAWTRWTRLAMIAEAAITAVLGGVGVWTLAQTDAPSTTVAGIRLGAPVLTVLLLTAAAVAATAAWPHRALRRVALGSAVAWTSMFLAAAVHYPGLGTAWASNAGTATLLAGLALAGFAEFVLLNAAVFDPVPGSRP